MGDTGTFGWKGPQRRAFEFPDGTPAALSGVAELSPVARARLVYNDTTKRLEVSLDGAAYVQIPTGSAPGPWTQTGDVIHQDTLTDPVAVGVAAVVGSELFRVVGDTLLAGDITFENSVTATIGQETTTSGDAPTLSIIGGNATDTVVHAGNVNVFGGDASDVNSEGGVVNIDAGINGAGVPTGSEVNIGGVNTRVVNIGGGAGFALVHVGLVDDQTDAFLLRQGTDNYLDVDTTDGTEHMTLGNATTNPQYELDGDGSLSLIANTITTFTLSALQRATADAAGRSFLFIPAEGGAGAAGTAGTGGTISLSGAKGGGGTGGFLAGIGGSALLRGGAGGDDGGGGGNAGGGVAVSGGAGSGAGADGSVDIGTTNTSAVNIGASADTIGFYGTTAVVRPAAYTITNPVSRRAYDTTTVTLPELAEVVGTLLQDDIDNGLKQ